MAWCLTIAGHVTRDTRRQIFRVLTPCFKLRTNGVLLHYADLAVNCESARFVSAKTVAIIMIFVYPLGIPSLYAFLLFRARRQINPLGCDALQAMRVRNELVNANPALRAQEFLFSCYRPGAYGFEVFECFRRIAMTGLIRYVAKASGPPIAGILLSLVSVIVFRETQPFENPSTNALSSFAMWQLLSTYLLAYALLFELKSAPESKLILIGGLLLASNLITLFAALYLQVTQGDRQVELSLTLAESEMRECELVHEQEQMRADIESLLKRTGLELKTSASSVESAAGPVGKAAKMQEQMFMSAVAECTDFPSFTKRLYPCWVISLTNLAAFSELPQHEDALEMLEELLPDSTSPSCAFSFFISQNWEGGRPGPPGHEYFNVRGRAHPDNKLNTKVRFL